MLQRASHSCFLGEPGFCFRSYEGIELLGPGNVLGCLLYLWLVFQSTASCGFQNVQGFSVLHVSTNISVLVSCEFHLHPWR